MKTNFNCRGRDNVVGKIICRAFELECALPFGKEPEFDITGKMFGNGTYFTPDACKVV